MSKSRHTESAMILTISNVSKSFWETAMEHFKRVTFKASQARWNVIQ